MILPVACVKTQLVKGINYKAEINPVERAFDAFLAFGVLKHKGRPSQAFLALLACLHSPDKRKKNTLL